MKTSFEEIVNVDEIGKQSGKQLHGHPRFSKRLSSRPVKIKKALFEGLISKMTLWNKAL